MQKGFAALYGVTNDSVILLQDVYSKKMKIHIHIKCEHGC